MRAGVVRLMVSATARPWARHPPPSGILRGCYSYPSFHSLSDTELCWRWRTSFAALAHAASPGQRLYLIETRCALLDELTHRDPEGFTRWLDSGARAASDPARFLTSTLRDRQLPHQDRDP